MENTIDILLGEIIEDYGSDESGFTRIYRDLERECINTTILVAAERDYIITTSDIVYDSSSERCELAMRRTQISLDLMHEIMNLRTDHNLTKGLFPDMLPSLKEYQQEILSLIDKGSELA
nr:hypothetical protein [Nanoarchaeum sp.]